MLDFNGANEQTDGGGSGPIIPHKSAVKLRITGIKQPSAQQKSNASPALILSVNDQGVESHGLVLLFDVVGGQFTGNTLSKWYTMQGGSDKAREFAFDAIRAMLDAAKGLDFTDNSPQALAARNMQNQGFGGFVGLEFPCEIKVKDIKPGDQYINNEIGNIVKVTDNRYQHIMAGGDVITEAAIPQLPQNNGGPANGGGNNYSAPNQGGNANGGGNNYSAPNQGGNNTQAPNQGNPNGGQGSQGQPNNQGGGYQNPNQGNQAPPDQGSQAPNNQGTYQAPNQAPNQGNPNGGPAWGNPNQGGPQPPDKNLPF